MMIITFCSLLMVAGAWRDLTTRDLDAECIQMALLDPTQTNYCTLYTTCCISRLEHFHQCNKIQANKCEGYKDFGFTTMCKGYNCTELATTTVGYNNSPMIEGNSSTGYNSSSIQGNSSSTESINSSIESNSSSIQGNSSSTESINSSIESNSSSIQGNSSSTESINSSIESNSSSIQGNGSSTIGYNSSSTVLYNSSSTGGFKSSSINRSTNNNVAWDPTTRNLDAECIEMGKLDPTQTHYCLLYTMCCNERLEEQCDKIEVNKCEGDKEVGFTTACKGSDCIEWRPINPQYYDDYP